MKLELKKLISSREFGELIRSEEPGFKNRIDYVLGYERLRNNYDDFLKQQLAIWMFVTCKLVDGVWVAIQEPLQFRSFIDLENEMDEETPLQVLSNCRAFKEAKDRVLFEGFYLKYSDKFVTTVSNEKLWFNFKSRNIFVNDKVVSMTEDLVKYNLELTPTAQKQICNV